MRKNFGSKPWVFPEPLFVVASYNEDGSPNAMISSWAGIEYEDRVHICLDPRRNTTENIVRTKAFTVCMATEKYAVACDYVGIVTGKKVEDKFEKAGFHATKSEFVNAPVINELLMSVECELITYDPESWQLVGRIMNVSADESILNEKGKPDPAKLHPIMMDTVNRKYPSFGEIVADAYVAGLALKDE